MGRHRDPEFERLRREEQLTVEAALRARDRRRVRRDFVERVWPQVTRPPEEPDPVATDDKAMAELIRRFRAEASAVLRSGRAAKAVSQRELAAALGMSQATLARLESGAGECSLGAVLRALAAVGGRLDVVASDAAAPPTRMSGEHARDQSGRRLPAHLAPYRLATPHSWWVGTTRALMWRNEPRWSFRRRPP